MKVFPSVGMFQSTRQTGWTGFARKPSVYPTRMECGTECVYMVYGSRVPERAWCQDTRGIVLAAGVERLRYLCADGVIRFKDV